MQGCHDRSGACNDDGDGVDDGRGGDEYYGNGDDDADDRNDYYDGDDVNESAAADGDDLFRTVGAMVDAAGMGW